MKKEDKFKTAEQIFDECSTNLSDRPEGYDPYITAMNLYAKQFIDLAEDIIRPAYEILPESYTKELEAWYSELHKNKLI